MNIVIKNPAPTDSRLKKWGDYHFGRSLGKFLQRLGCSVTTQYDGQWRDPIDADVTLVLRGKYACPPGPGAGLRLLWVISHAEDVTTEELDSYDLVYVASELTAVNWQEQTAVPVKPLLQCTDCEDFRNLNAGPRRGVVFVGNTRAQQRELVSMAAALGLAPQVWGRGWEEIADAPPVQADYIENERLGLLYSNARLTLNDHWPDMRAYSIVNNRVFDALACGLPVLTDYNPGLADLDLPGILTYQDQQSLQEAVERYLFCYPSIEKAANSARSKIEKYFSFEARARQIVTDARVMLA